MLAKSSLDSEIPGVGEDVEDTWICCCGGEGGGASFFNCVGFGNGDDTRCDVIDGGDDGLSGGCAVAIGDCQGDVVVTVVGECMDCISIYRWSSTMSKVSTIS